MMVRISVLFVCVGLVSGCGSLNTLSKMAGGMADPAGVEKETALKNIQSYYEATKDMSPTSDHWNNTGKIVAAADELSACTNRMEGYRVKQTKSAMTGQKGPMFDFDKDTITVAGDTVTLAKVEAQCKAMEAHIKTLTFTACDISHFLLEEVAANGKWGTTRMYHASSKATDLLAKYGNSSATIDYRKPTECQGPLPANNVTSDGEALLSKVQSVCGKGASIQFKDNWYVKQLNPTSSRRSIRVSCGVEQKKAWFK